MFHYTNILSGDHKIITEEIGAHKCVTISTVPQTLPSNYASLTPQRTKDILRKSTPTISKLLISSDNRISLAVELYGSFLITDEAYFQATAQWYIEIFLNRTLP